MRSSTASSFEPVIDLQKDNRKYPSIRDYYEASSTTDEKPITYQKGLSNFSSLNLGDDRIMFKESVMTATFKPEEPPELTEFQIRNRQKPAHARRREYIDAVAAVSWDEVDRMERIIRDKLRQRSFATSSPFQVRKSFKFFDHENNGGLDQPAFANALMFLGFEFGEKQITALFARYDVALTGFIDYMLLYKTCMIRDDDKPNGGMPIPDKSHLYDDMPSEKGGSQASGGSVSLGGFEDILEEDEMTQELRIIQQAEVKRVFNMIDSSKRGFIMECDIELLLMSLNLPMTPGEMDLVKFQIGPRDGKISFENFFSWWFVATKASRSTGSNLCGSIH